MVIVSLLLNARRQVELEDETVPVLDDERAGSTGGGLRGTDMAHMLSGEKPPTKGSTYLFFSLAVKPGEFVFGGSPENAQMIFLFNNQIFKTCLGKKTSEQHGPPFKWAVWGGNELRAYFFFSVVLQENVKNQQLKAVL